MDEQRLQKLEKFAELDSTSARLLFIFNEFSDFEKRVEEVVKLLKEQVDKDSTVRESQIREIARKIVVKGDKGDRGEKGEKGERGERGRDGKDGENAVITQETINDIAFSVETQLPTVVATHVIDALANLRIDASQVDNLEENIDVGKLDFSGVRLDAGQIDNLPQSRVSMGSSGIERILSSGTLARSGATEIDFGNNLTVSRTPNGVRVDAAAGGEGSVDALDDIGDVTITSVADNEVLAYDNSSGEWINQTAAEAGLAAASHTHTVSDITDAGDLASLDSVTTTQIAAATLVTAADTIASNDNDTTIPTSAAVKDAIDGAVASGVADGDKGDITVSSTGTVWTIDSDVVTYAKMQNVSATNRILGRITTGAGDTEELTAANVRTIINVEDNADVTDAGNVGSVNAAATAKTTPVDADTFPITDTEASNVIKKLSFTNLKAFLKTYFDTIYSDALGTDDNYVTDAEKTVIGNTSGTNTGDQSSIVGITGTKAQFDTAVTDGNFLYSGDITQYTDELAQDAVGGILGAEFTYSDDTPSIVLATGGIDETKLDASVNASLDLADSAVQDLSDLGITATAAEINYIDGVTSAIQTQLDAKANLSGGNTFLGSQVFDGATADRIAIFGASKNLTIASTTTYPSLTEFAYVKGVTSAIQTQIDGKAATSHTHTASQVTDFDTEVANNTDVAANTAARHDAVTLAGEDYLAVSGQEITANPIDLDNLSATGTASSATFLRGDNTWATPAGSGDVSKVGTPVDNQVGVWTGNGTIEGDAGLTWDGSVLAATDVTVTDEAYGSSWNGSTEVPTKNAVYDKIETLSSSGISEELALAYAVAL